MSDKFKGNLALLITAMVWGTGFISQKLGGEAMPPMTFNASRQLMAAIVLIPLAVYTVRSNGYFSGSNNTEPQIAYKRNKMIRAAILCGGILTIASDMQQVGLATVSVGKSGFISATYVVFVPILGIFLGQKVKSKTIICAVMALCGFAVMSLRFDGGMTQGDWLTLISSFGFSIQMQAINHYVDKDNSMLLSVLEMAGCGVMGLIFGILVEHPTLAQFSNAAPVLLYTVLVPTCIGYPGQVIGQKYTDSTTAAMIMSLEAVFAAVFGALFLKESMSLRELAGSAIIFAAVIIGQIDIKK